MIIVVFVIIVGVSDWRTGVYLSVCFFLIEMLNVSENKLWIWGTNYHADNWSVITAPQVSLRDWDE